MTSRLVLSFRFLSSTFHGRGDEGTPEWPPSPLRMFQALVAAAARAGSLESSREAFAWLEGREAPHIIASQAVMSSMEYRLSVPHNAMDLVAAQWSKGGEGEAAKHRAMKSVRPFILPENAVVHYVWNLDGSEIACASVIAAARGVAALGWGVDLVVGNGVIVNEAEFAQLAIGLVNWVPRHDGRRALRTPITGSLVDLERRHAAVVGRTSQSDRALIPPPPLTSFSITRYARADERHTTKVAAFMLLRVDSDSFRAFDTMRRGMVVSGMLRHAVRNAAESAGWQAQRVNATILGHGEAIGGRLLLVPVPSIEPRGADAETVTAVRRVMVYSTADTADDTTWVARALAGNALIDEATGEIQAVLCAAPDSDRVLKRYVAESRVWTTVTPMVLDGYDDPRGVRDKLRNVTNAADQSLLLEKINKRREALVRKALRHAGISDELAFSAGIETQETGFIAGVDKASRYAVPAHLAKLPLLHVKITWPHEVSGPICIGRGRFSGLGLCVAMSN